MLSSVMIWSTTSRLVFVAPSPSFSNCLNSFSTVLWSFFSKTMASGKAILRVRGVDPDLPRCARLDHAGVGRCRETVGEHTDESRGLVGREPDRGDAAAGAPRAEDDASHLEVPRDPKPALVGTHVREPLAARLGGYDGHV